MQPHPQVNATNPQIVNKRSLTVTTYNPLDMKTDYWQDASSTFSLFGLGNICAQLY
ncbi:MAG: hypothetical protein F6K14_23440 [Symploca sp. SIO2C1]|nr:hypothetical protein [Symploca sp. SIO2C1]